MPELRDILRLLPLVYRESAQPGNPLHALLEVMAELPQPVENAWRELDRCLDPRRAPDAFVPYLAGWVALDRFFPRIRRSVRQGYHVHPRISTGLGPLRELVARAAELSRWRGTAKGLRLFLEIATGEGGFVVEENVPDESGDPRPFFFRVSAPAHLAQHESLLLAIMESEKPAYVSCELRFTEPEESAEEEPKPEPAPEPKKAGKPKVRNNE